MKKFFIVFPILAALDGCGQQSKIEAAVKEQLTDPASAQFKDLVMSQSGNHACIVWNARNRMGGYGDWDIAELKKTGDGWTVLRIQGNEVNCTAENLRFLDTFDKLKGSMD